MAYRMAGEIGYRTAQWEMTARTTEDGARPTLL